MVLAGCVNCGGDVLTYLSTFGRDSVGRILFSGTIRLPS